MITFAPAPVFDMSGDQGGHGGAHHGLKHSPEIVPPKVSPELARRFRALIEEVTDELMRGTDLDRSACRADAIALLVATSDQFDDDEKNNESPLRYLLLEEQAKAAAGLCETGDQPLAFMRV